MDTASRQQNVNATLRSRFARNELLLSTFVKTVSPHTVEVLGESGLDLVVLDAEHAPFDRHGLDMGCLAARAARMPAMVRVPGRDATHILQALDSGADGLLIPHVDSPQEAREVVRAARYREHSGQRGFSNSPRAGHYGVTPLKEHVSQSDAGIAVVVQIESRRSVEALAEILAVPGIDGIFVGRADLAVSHGVDTLGDPVVQACVELICERATAASVPLGTFLPDASEVQAFHEMGFRFFVLGSDQSLMRTAANQAAHAARLSVA